MANEGDTGNTPQPAAADQSATPAGNAPVSTIEKNLMNVAEELGAWLGKAERKTADLLSEQNLREHLVRIRDTAARLLAQVEKGRERTR